MKICVYAIAKNEAEFVERFCQSAKGADLILIADTGSADDTKALAELHGAVVHDIYVSPWRFDVARNAAMALIPADMDICVSLDLDEVLQPGWREEIERVWVEGVTTRLRYNFDWGRGIEFRYEKIHARHGYHWKYAVHEYPVADPRITEVWAEAADWLMVKHMPNDTPRSAYLDLLKMAYEEEPMHAHNAFYYARELLFWNQYEEAVQQGLRYLGIPNTSRYERCYAERVIAESYLRLRNVDDAIRYYLWACGEAPDTREPWMDLARLMKELERWEECYAYATAALNIKSRYKLYTCDPTCWGSRPHDYAALAAFNLGMFRDAVRHGIDALNYDPDDERLRRNLERYKAPLIGVPPDLPPLMIEELGANA